MDVGCGSGILGMLALKFGAKYVVGTDLDPCAITATHENMEKNEISDDCYEVMIGNIIDDAAIQDKVRQAVRNAADTGRPSARELAAGQERAQGEVEAAGGYDIVVANILAEVLVELTPVAAKQLKPGGIYITSGIIDDKEQVVVECVKKAGLEVLEVTYQGEWVSVTARKV